MLSLFDSSQGIEFLLDLAIGFDDFFNGFEGFLILLFIVHAVFMLQLGTQSIYLLIPLEKGLNELLIIHIFFIQFVINLFEFYCKSKASLDSLT